MTPTNGHRPSLCLNLQADICHVHPDPWPPQFIDGTVCDWMVYTFYNMLTLSLGVASHGSTHIGICLNLALDSEIFRSLLVNRIPEPPGCTLYTLRHWYTQNVVAQLILHAPPSLLPPWHSLIRDTWWFAQCQVGFWQGTGNPYIHLSHWNVQWITLCRHFVYGTWWWMSQQVYYSSLRSATLLSIETIICRKHRIRVVNSHTEVEYHYRVF
jgi:hypothetical protein